MARKKVSLSQKDKTLPKQEVSVKTHQRVTPSMGSEASEKLESLKSLNQMLLKEAFDRRQQVDSLIQTKGSLVIDLTRSNSEMESVQSELTRLAESAARLELERNVTDVFVGVQLGLKGEVIQQKMSELKRVIDEKEIEIEKLIGKLNETEDALGNERVVSTRVCLERDEVMDKLDLQLEEDKGLRVNLMEFKERMRTIVRELEEFRVAYNAVVEERRDMEMRIESITREKDSIMRSLVESNKLVEEMKEEVDRIVKEKEGIEEDKTTEMVRRQELERAVSGLNEMVIDLEKKCFVGEGRQKEMGREIDQLVEEKNLGENKLQGLASEKTDVQRVLSETLKQFAEEKHRIEVMVNENTVILEAKDRLESEVSALRNQVAKLKAVVLKFEESSRVEVDQIKSLESEIGNYRYNLEQVKTQRDETKNYLDEPKPNALRLKEKIGTSENKIQKSLKTSEKVKVNNTAVFVDKVELESHSEILKKEISSSDNTITEAKKEFSLMKGKVEKADANSDVVLSMLKDTAAFCLKDDERYFLGSGEEETEAYVVELEIIKDAFKNKARKIDGMKRQLELLQSSVEDAHKKKSFWTVLSSATTLLAAVLLAYVARH